MYNTDLLEEEEYILCKSKMEKQTFTLFMDACDKCTGEGIPGPLLGVIDVCEDKEHWGKFWTRISDFKRENLSHKGYYADLIMVLAYTIFGYGNWSNNDRIRKGLKPIRFKQY